MTQSAPDGHNPPVPPHLSSGRGPFGCPRHTGSMRVRPQCCTAMGVAKLASGATTPGHRTPNTPGRIGPVSIPSVMGLGRVWRTLLPPSVQALSVPGECKGSTSLLDGKRTAPAQFPGAEGSVEMFLLKELLYPSPAAPPPAVNTGAEGGGTRWHLSAHAVRETDDSCSQQELGEPPGSRLFGLAAGNPGKAFEGSAILKPQTQRKRPKRNVLSMKLIQRLWSPQPAQIPQQSLSPQPSQDADFQAPPLHSSFHPPLQFLHPAAL